MTALDFPTSPSNGDTYENYVYDSTDGVWKRVPAGVDLNDLTDVTLTSPVAGEKLVFDGTNWVNLEGYVFVETVYFTSSGTFTKATYPWLRAIRVKVQAGGAGGAGATTTGSGQVSGGSGGSSGGYSESFITDIAGLDASIPVTRGDGGLGGAAGVAGNAGTGSSFGSLVTANPGLGAFRTTASTPPVGGVSRNDQPAAGTGDIAIGGKIGERYLGLAAGGSFGGSGADSVLGSGGGGQNFARDGLPASGFGAGGGGGANAQNQGTARDGGNGSNGIVIVELYA